MPDKPPSLRARQAERTQDEILSAARRLFAERGYARTTVRDIAQAAGVSAQTVYDSIGTKQALVARLNDLIDAEAGIGAIAAAAARSGDPRQLAGLSARVTRSILEHCGDILHALVTGAAAEPDLAEVLEEGHRRHVEGARFTVRHLKELDALAEGVTVEAAADTLSAISDVRFALLLRDSYGWSLDQIEAWITSTAHALLLPPTRPRRAPRRSTGPSA
jgi:AcrR family transcriptional regulator